MIGEQARGLRQRARHHAGTTASARLGPHAVAIASGKGGVGKTSIATALAVCAAHSGLEVLLVDLDLGLANAHLLLGASAGPGLLETLADGAAPAEALRQARPGLQLLAGARDPDATLRLSGTERATLLEAIASLGRRADLVLLDLPAGIGDVVADAATAAGHTLLVTTPEPAALTDAYALLKRLALHTAKDDTRVQLLVNAARHRREAAVCARRVQRAARRFLGRDVGILDPVPEDPAVRDAARTPCCFVDSAPCGAATRAVRRVLRTLRPGRRPCPPPALLWKEAAACPSPPGSASPPSLRPSSS